MTRAISYRHLGSLDDLRAVVALEKAVWRYTDSEDVVPTPILAVTVKRGGILIGAFAGKRLVGFVYSLPAMKDGRPTQWSHMLGVLDDYRGTGVGYQLKVLQRGRALEMGLDLIEWTYDPLQAVNAHLNFSKLGVVVHEYEENIYGESSSALHRGNPTDRFVAEWWIRDERVVARLAGGAPLGSVLAVEPAVRAKRAGAWLEPSDVDVSLAARHVSLEIPMDFTTMLAQAPDQALRWRIETRRVFTSYFARGFRVVEFFLDPDRSVGTYQLAADGVTGRRSKAE